MVRGELNPDGGAPIQDFALPFSTPTPNATLLVQNIATGGVRALTQTQLTR